MDQAAQVPDSKVKIGNENWDCGNSTTTTNNTINGDVRNFITISEQQLDKEKGEILKWISPLELPDRHRDVRELRFKGVGNWLLEGCEFSNWADGSADPTLFCYGDPGAGKTCISSLVIDTLRSKAGKRGFLVLDLYCDYPTHKEQTATDLIAGLLKKVVIRLDGVPEGVGREFKNSGNYDRPGLSRLLKMLDTILASFKRAFICIDALDEFPPKQRPKLLNSLEELVKQSPKTRLFLTGRPQIRHEIKRHHLGKSAQIISVKAREEEIERYITHRLGDDQYPDEMNSELENEIMEILPQKVSGIFLLVYLKMNAILEEVTIHDRRERLLGMEDSPELLGEYSKTLDRIAEQGHTGLLALKGLTWLCYSKRPLRVDELRHALAIEKESAIEKEPAIFDPKQAPSARTLSGCCLGLVTVNSEESTIHLIHSTLREYLLDNPKHIQRTNLTIAETCLTYLNFEYIKSLPLSLTTAPADTPFLQYASCYWGEHAREETTGHVEALAKQLLGLYDKHISAKLLLLKESWPWGHDPEGLPHGFSGLHCAAFFGLRKTAIAFLDTEVPDSSRKDITGSTPLTWAARNGHKELVQLLLERKFDPEAEDNDWRTPFSWAARNGHTGVVTLFLEGCAIDLETKDSFGRTPLSWASGGGHGDVVKLLVEKGGADANCTDNDGCTPVSRAAEEGNEGIVSFFIHRRGVNPNLSDRDGRTLLSKAAENGRCSVVKLLLDQPGIVSDKADNYGMTPLSRAASKGNEAVVKLFMEKGKTGTDLLAKDGSTSLWWAAGSGHAGVVKLLLGWRGINPNFVQEYGQTPLARAAMHGHEQVVKLLLESKYANHDSADYSGRTSLSWAAGNGHEKVVKLLLRSGGINTELADKSGQTPLSWAARNGNEGAAQLLLKEGNANPHSRDTNGRVPISWAADKGHGKLVSLLLSQPDVNPNSRDNIGRTSLSWAAGNGREAVTNLLLSQSNIEPNVVDSDGRTPLSWAAGNGWEAVVNLLLRQANVEPNMEDNVGRTPLSWAAGNGWEAVANLLLRQVDIKPNMMDSVGRTPLSWAAGNGWEALVNLLLSRGNIEPDVADGVGRTPLSWAAWGGCDEVVQLLIDRPDVNPDSTDGDNRTPLSRAAEKGHEETIRLLLGKSKANPDSADCDGQTPLLWAARNGHEGIVQQLLKRVDDPDLASNDDRTPLFWAAYGGHQKAVELLLQQDGVNPHPVDKYGRTPLSWAQENQHLDVVRLFQQHKPVPTTPCLPDSITEPPPLTFNTQIRSIFSTIYHRVP